MHVKQHQLRLPIWPDEVRGAPNALLRSALFAGKPSRFRETLEFRRSAADEPTGIEIAAQSGISLHYTGTQLNQYDADVFFEVLHRVRRRPLGELAHFNGCNFLRAIGRGSSKSDYEDLDMSLRRLKRGVLDARWFMDNRELYYTGSLLDSLMRDATSKEYCVTMSPNIKRLFEKSSFTYIEQEQRQQLLRSPLAQWLHGYYSTHARPFCVGIAFLRTLSGQQSARPRDFSRSLRKALALLQQQLGWTIEWQEDDTLKITKPVTGAQSRHLKRNRKSTQVFKQQSPGERAQALTASRLGSSHPSSLQPVKREQGTDGLTPLSQIFSGAFS